ncbi:hypothetical protein [Gloeobacter kilaueensis]|uniref:Uncharacterized protein n=1 Tax=Gloeobacter kilaueensis (strain ATCC BAA-2537 / CCAP 1431/1 / ULC 316 / JS1) TaxID=1183438 RepID=U5QBW7_GLOK1|nr:hypothetical protein [Gloeobacter kilaueensis]AGY56387.1 hypothetical protein GKIL_0140 [Gloeobacter kilaueensis JS1]
MESILLELLGEGGGSISVATLQGVLTKEYVQQVFQQVLVAQGQWAEDWILNVTIDSPESDWSLKQQPFVFVQIQLVNNRNLLSKRVGAGETAHDDRGLYGWHAAVSRRVSQLMEAAPVLAATPVPAEASGARNYYLVNFYARDPVAGRASSHVCQVELDQNSGWTQIEGFNNKLPYCRHEHFLTIGSLNLPYRDAWEACKAGWDTVLLTAQHLVNLLNYLQAEGWLCPVGHPALAIVFRTGIEIALADLEEAIEPYRLHAVA